MPVGTQSWCSTVVFSVGIPGELVRVTIYACLSSAVVHSTGTVTAKDRFFQKRGFGRGFGFRTDFLTNVLKLQRIGREGNWVTMKGSTSTNRSCLVYSFNNRHRLLQLRV
jgi:hypothetical protein